MPIGPFQLNEALLEKYDINLIFADIDKQLIYKTGLGRALNKGMLDDYIIISVESIPDFMSGTIVFTYKTVGWKEVSYKTTETETVFSFKK